MNAGAVSRGVQGVQLNLPPLQINDIHDYNYCHAFEKLRAEMYILHRRRKRGGGARGATRPPPPPSFKLGGIAPPPPPPPPTLPTVYIMNFIAVS